MKDLRFRNCILSKFRCVFRQEIALSGNFVGTWCINLYVLILRR